jgi:hypothetical protein
VQQTIGSSLSNYSRYSKIPRTWDPVLWMSLADPNCINQRSQGAFGTQVE